MKTLSIALTSLLLLTGCAQTPNSNDQIDNGGSAEEYPTPAIADNRVPKTCQLPELQTLVSELAGESVETDPNPVNRQNSNQQNYQDYLDGKYLVCIYKSATTEKAAYIFWREADLTEWETAMSQLNAELAENELPFQPFSLGLGEPAAYYLIEPEEAGGFLTAHTFVDNISLIVFTNVAKTLEDGTRLMTAAVNQMP
ncbi:MAG: hypothetical protein ACKOXT_02310 [Actinomycetota bacterium]